MTQLKKLIELMTKYFEQQTDLSWNLIDNIDWIVPLFVSFLFSALTITVVLLTTKRQIKNQNKENHRPFLEMEMTHSDLKGRNTLNRMFFINGNSLSEFFSKLVIRNIGVGVAFKIKFYEKERDLFIEHTVTLNDIPNTLNLENSKAIEFDFFADCKELKYGKIANVLCLYSDLYGNIYKVFMEFSKKKGGHLPGSDPLVIIPKHVQMEHTSEISLKYKEKIVKCKVDENRVINKYKNA